MENLKLIWIDDWYTKDLEVLHYPYTFDDHSIVRDSCKLNIFYSGYDGLLLENYTFT